MLTPTGNPTSYKPLYDFLSYLATQLAFSFAVAPFVLLTLSASFQVWSQVYFYCPIGIILSMAFFASPAKQYLVRLQEQRVGQSSIFQKTGATLDSKSVLAGGASLTPEEKTVMGVPSDPEQELDEIMKEVSEVDVRRWMGNKDIKGNVQEKGKSL